ncbi:IS4 family transposase [Streptomyces sp. NPDC048527]|uniref:IS4 family transposase n=1 Tax=Streptomyces sp. NPDC048527 TaxID=3365568 RepID=UPI0037155F52
MSSPDTFPPSAVPEETRTVQRRLRCLPSRVGMYFVLALALFPSIAYLRVWDKLSAGLHGHARPSEKALRDVRRRLGPAPLKALFETMAVPLAQPTTPGVRYRRWRTVAFDGCSAVKVPDSERNRAWLGKIQGRLGWAGYPLLRLVTLCETGTRGLLGAAFGPISLGETGYARQLLPLLSKEMLLLTDRGFDADEFLAEVAGTGAQLLFRVTARRRPAVLTVLADGSYLTLIGPLKIRIIDAEITMTTSGGDQLCERYRLATTLLGHRLDPADALVRRYRERWEIESAFYALRHTMLDGAVLRSGYPSGLEQEVWAQLTLYQVLRMAVVDAVESRPGTDPDRASFSIARETARDEIVLNAGRGPNPRDVLIGTALLTGLLPKRRARTSARTVKARRTRYPTRSGEPGSSATTHITNLAVTLHPAPLSPPAPAHDAPQDGRRASRGPGPVGAGYRNRVLHFMSPAPDRAWTPMEVATALHVRNTHSFATQMGQWVTDGLLRKIGRGKYVLADTWRSTPLTVSTIA